MVLPACRQQSCFITKIEKGQQAPIRITFFTFLI
jgi:hypothetical protein